MNRKTRTNQLLEAGSAIDNYLAELLKEVEEYVPSRAETKVDISPVDTDKQTTGVEVERKPLVQLEQEPEQDESVIVPDWAANPFQCLLFKVNGLTLGIPLTGLNTILEWDEEASVVPGQPDWHLGILLERGGKIGVVDTARLVMPERVSSRTQGERQRGGYVLVIGDGRFGLACDSIANTISMTQDQVRWRSDKGKRPWLAGTIKEQLCALLDIDAVLGMISA